jgi:hypothetical protein
MSYNWQTFTTTAPSVDIPNPDSGTYEFKIVSINGLGQRSQITTLQQTVATQAAVPPNPTGASITPIDETTGLLSWDATTNVSVRIGGVVIVRHQPVMSGALWESSTQIVPNVAGSQSSTIVPLLQGTYLLKFGTSGSIRSAAAATTTVDLPRPHSRLLVSSLAEDTAGFPGTLNGLYYSAEHGGLSISGGALFDTLAADNNFDALGTLDSLGGVSSSGEYLFAAGVDLGAVYDANLRRRLDVLPLNVATLFDDNLGDLDTWGDLDGTDVTDTNVLLYVRSTPDDPAGTPTWSEWRICTNNMLRGRGFQFKATAFSEQISQNTIITQVGAIVELQQRVEHSAVLSSDAGIDGLALDGNFDALGPLDTLSTFTITYANAFYDLPAINITPLNMGTGEYFTLSSVTSNDYQVRFFNSGGDLVSRQFTHTSVGHGRRI